MRALLWAVATWGLGVGGVPPIPISQLLTPCQVTGLDSLKPKCATIQVLENRSTGFADLGLEPADRPLSEAPSQAGKRHGEAHQQTEHRQFGNERHRKK